MFVDAINPIKRGLTTSEVFDSPIQSGLADGAICDNLIQNGLTNSAIIRLFWVGKCTKTHREINPQIRGMICKWKI